MEFGDRAAGLLRAGHLLRRDLFRKADSNAPATQIPLCQTDFAFLELPTGRFPNPMLLVTFHGGSTAGSINNAFAFYDTSSGALLTATALAVPKHRTLSELRAMVLKNGNLYVANGAKSTSTVLCYAVPSSGADFQFLATVIGPKLSGKGHFETAIAHPFGIDFNGADICYVSNQDTNVVAEVSLTDGAGGHARERMPVWHTSIDFFREPPAVFLDGTYKLHRAEWRSARDVKITATAVPLTDGGLGVSFDAGKVKNSVRDVCVANGILFVCDEPDSLINLYSLADGTFLGSSNKLSSPPTHFEVWNGGLYASAGSSALLGTNSRDGERRTCRRTAGALAGRDHSARRK